MIEAFVAAIICAVFFAIPIAILFMMIDDILSTKKGISFLFVWSVVVFTIIFYSEKQADEKGPCLEYQTQMTWNAATKTMMPARICVVRGEWVK